MSATQLSPLPAPAGLAVGDGWVDPGRWEPVRFPYDGSEVASAPVGGVTEAEQALAAAAAARREVASLPTHRRRAILRAVEARIAEQADELAELLVLETGKPLVDCRIEVARTRTTFEVAADEAGRISGETIPLDLSPAGEGMTGFWVRKPIGVVVGITGFNYPLLLAAHKVAPALAAGCPIIVKPAPATPLATLHLARLLRECGAPPSAVQVVTGDVEVGDLLVRDERSAAISFTGSAAVGHAIAANAGAKKVILELGSNAALLVAADADLDRAADACVRGGYYASGQACIAVQRVLVEAPAYERVAERVAAAAARLPVGDPRLESTRVAPLINPAATARVNEWLDEALQAGARLLAGGPVAEGQPLGPTVVADVPSGCRLWDEEVFGPVVALRPVESFQAGLEAVNDSAYGLHASVFTRDLGNVLAAVDALEVGGVVVNEVPGFRADNMPYGGVKRSGTGREGPRFAIEELTVTRMVLIRP